MQEVGLYRVDGVTSKVKDFINQVYTRQIDRQIDIHNITGQIVSQLDRQIKREIGRLNPLKIFE